MAIRIMGGWGISVLNLQATRTDYVQDKVFDRDFRVILNCQSESSRIRRIPIEYVLEIPCIMHDAIFGPRSNSESSFSDPGPLLSRSNEVRVDSH